MSQCTPRVSQVSGGLCSLTMFKEATPGCVEPGTKGVRLAFHSESFGPGTSKNPRTVIDGKRGAGKPYAGLANFTGGLEMAAYSPQLGYILAALCGPATTTPDPERTLDAAANVIDLDIDIVGLPCTGHGFVQDAVITIYGTANYDGVYRVAPGVTEDIIAIAAPYVAEALPADAKAHRGRAAFLDGEARMVDANHVALPVKSGSHALKAGDTITITGTANYDGTYTVGDSCSGDLVVEAAFVDETLDPTTAIAVPKFFKHVFPLPKKQPSICMEKYLDFDPGAATFPYQRYGFCKVNGLSFDFGGDDELIFSIEFAVGRQQDSAETMDASPIIPAAVPMDSIDSALWVNGVRVGDVETGSFSASFGIEPHAAIGDLGQYSRLPEGNPETTATLNAFLETDKYNILSKDRSTIDFAVSFCASAGDEAWFRYPESELDVPGTPITGKEGLMQEITVQGFVDCKDTVLISELINRVAAYA